MLQRDLKRIANESVFNPNNPSPTEKILLDVGSLSYYLTRAMERIAIAKTFTDDWDTELKEAIKLLILVRTQNDLQSKSKS